MKVIQVLITLLMYAVTANAYIGPGMGGGVIVAILGVLGSIFLALFAILYYPIKRAIRKKKKNKLAIGEAKEDNDDDSDNRGE